MWNNQKISLVLPAYNEEPNIARAVRDFKALGLIDEILVVDNNSTDATEAEAKAAGATVVKETRQGYGYAIRGGLAAATGDLIAVCEPDGTFRPGDLHKLLAYAGDFEFVVGSRTSRALLSQDANMGIFLKWGNWSVAKLLEFLYDGPSLTDVGCTYRLIRRDALHKIQGDFRVGANHFSPDMMICAIRRRVKMVEIPVHYEARIGESKITGDFVRAFRLGLRMIWLILARRVGG